jgi:hypothetical protein
MSLHELCLAVATCLARKDNAKEQLYSNYNTWKQLVDVIKECARNCPKTDNVLITFSRFLLCFWFDQSGRCLLIK